jgi:tetratricopeptide (TPR) repeat protein
MLNLDPSEALTLNEEMPTDFIGLATTISRAIEQKQRLVAEIGKLDNAARLMQEAMALEGKKDLAGALARADTLLEELPEHPVATAFVDRLSVEWGARDPRWKRQRVEELVSQAKRLLQPEAWARCYERIERARALDGDNEKVLALGERIERHRDETRRQREHAKRADALVRQARAKLMKEGDPRACLTILSEALSLRPDHSAGRELWERAQNELDQQLAAAAADTAAVAVLSATQAMGRGDLALASRELSRAEQEFPEHTEIPAIATQLIQAKEAQVETLLERSRASLGRNDYDACVAEARELLALEPSHREASALVRDARKQAVRRATSPRRRTPAVMTLVASVIALALAGVVGWNVLRSEDLTPPPIEDPSTTSAPLATTSLAPSTTVAPPPLTTSAPPPTSSSVEPTSTISTTTTSQPTTTVLTTTTAPITTTSIPPPPTTIALAPREQILGLMARYETAYETLDVDLLGALYPSVPLAVKNSFQNFESLTLDMQPLAGPSLDRSTAGRTATATYRIVQTIEPKIGKKTTSRHQASFQFAGIGNAWIIVSIDWNAE